jgi:thioesterase domain-containing protein/acyl carrier protein
VIARPDGHHDLKYLAQLIAREGVTWCSFVPSMLRVLLEQEDIRRHLSPLRIASNSGEALTPDLLERVSDQLDVDFYNIYGPTETSVGIICWKCHRDYEYGTIPIGRPVDNVKVYILDETGSQVPVGAVGELYVGGVAVGRGYLNRPELTRQTFLPDPFSEEAGARMYKTGDRGRYLPDGNIEFLGRADEQIKIRGNRVELGEIETVLGRHPAVVHAVVIAYDNAPGDKRLAAYVVAREAQVSGNADDGQLADDLRRHVRQSLPDYMVPATFLFLDQLPQLSSGKVDRKALPAPTPSAPQRHDQYVAPQTPMEQRLAAVWSELLQLDRVGTDDNFFEIGGHSLLAVRLVARVCSELDIDVPVATLFAEPTLAGFAQYAAAAQRGETADQTVQPAAETESPAPTAERHSSAATTAANSRSRSRETSGATPKCPNSHESGYQQASPRCTDAVEYSPTAGARSLARLRDGGPGTPLFCIHGLGGHVAALMPLAKKLAAQRSVYGFQGRGLDPGQEPHDRIEDMAACYLDEIRRVMAMLDTHFAVARRGVEELNDAAVVRAMVPHLNIRYAEIKRLPIDEQWAFIQEKAQQKAGVPAADIRRLADVCKAHLAAIGQFTPPTYAGPVVLLRATQPRRRLDKRWKMVCPQLQVERVPGNHFNMLRPPHVNTLAERLSHYFPDPAPPGPTST